MKKLVTLALALALALSLMSGAALAQTSGVSITILMGKPEVASQFEQMLSDYSAKTGVQVTMIPLAGQDAYEKMTSLYASGNAPTILMVGQEFAEFQDKFLDLSATPFVAKAGAGTTDFVTVDGKVYGAPTTVEAYGIIYNPAVTEKVLGADFDPSAIRTQDQLKDFFEKLKAAGVGPFTLSPMDWSLGAHLSNTVYTAQSPDHAARHQFIEDLKSGAASLKDNSVFNGWVDLFDMLLAYNVHADSALAPVYEDGTMELATGEAAAWFMGNWAYPQLAAIAQEGYKFIPLPISNNPDDYANGKIAIGVPSYWCVDQSASSPEQQQAALDFLTWFITSPEGQDYYVNKLNFIPAYGGFEVSPADAMSQQIAQLLNEGNSLEWMNTYYPAGGFQVMGAAMQKYVDKVIDRAGLAAAFEDYWKSVK